MGFWGEDVVLEFGGEENLENLDYDSSKYEYCKRNIRLLLFCLDEFVIDYDLIEEFFVYVDDVIDDGVVLVFLFGIGEVIGFLDRFVSLSRFKDAVFMLLYFVLMNVE